MPHQYIALENDGENWAVSQISVDPLAYLTEVLLATSEAWEQLPGLAPLLLREALAELLEAAV
jgi:hypothetical protein